MQQESAHELVGHQSHRFVARAATSAVVLPTKGNAAIIRREEPRVGDRHPMGVARQIGEHGLGSGEGAFGIDDPFTLAQRHEPVCERIGVGQIEVIAEELQLPITMQVLQFFEEAASKEPREHSYGEEEPRLARYPSIGIGRETAAGYDAMHVRMVS